MVDRIETLVSQFERKEISRRQLIGALLAAAAATGGKPAEAADTIFKGQQINHVTLGVSNLNRSREFYERVFGATVWHDGTKQGQGFYDLGLGGKQSFISISEKLKPGVMNHMCVGVSNFDPDRDAAAVKKAFPDQNPTPQKISRVNGQPLVWPSFSVKDPDGLSVQVGDTKYQLDGRR